MKKHFLNLRSMNNFPQLVMLFMITACFHSQAQAQKIFEVYSQGGALNSTWRDDYVILSGFTPNQNLTGAGYSLHHRTGTSNAAGNWKNLVLAGTADGYGFFRVQFEEIAPAGTTAVPAWTSEQFVLSASVSTFLGNGGGTTPAGPSLILTNNSTALSGITCPTSNVLDVCGYAGTGASASVSVCPEGTTAPSTSGTRSRRRLIVSGTIQDTDVNGTDFQTVLNPYETPTTITSSFANVTSTSADLGGNIATGVDANNIERGVVYGTSTNPTIANATKVVIGNGTGTYSSNVTGLTPNTLYYVRAYMVNGAGVNYGAEVSFSACIAPSITTPAAVTNVGALCPNTTVNFSVTAAGEPLAYLWSGTGTFTNGTTTTPSLTGGATGTYTVTVSNACGSVPSNVNATILTLNAPVFAPITLPICSKTPVVLTANTTSGTPVYSTLSNVPAINSSNGTVATPTGNFTVIAKVTNACGTKQTSKVITVTQKPNLTVVNPATQPSVNITLKPAVYSGSYLGTVSFLDTDNATILSNPTAITSSGTYYIKATNGTCSTTKPVVVTIGASRWANNTQEEAGFYPNPVNDELYISGNFPANIHVIITNMLGMEVLKTDILEGSEKRISLQTLSNGIYSINIIDEKGEVLYENKLVKE